MARVAEDVGGRIGSNHRCSGVALDGCEVGFEVGLDLAGAVGVGVSHSKTEGAGGGHCQRCRGESGGKNVAEMHRSECCSHVDQERVQMAGESGRRARLDFKKYREGIAQIQKRVTLAREKTEQRECQ